MKDNYLKNVESAKKIAKHFNIELHSCNPDWRFKESYPFEKTFDLSDNMMGKLAILFGLKWNWNKGTGIVDISAKIGRINETTKFYREALKSLEKSPKIIDKKSIDGMIKGQKEQLKFQEELTAKTKNELKVLEKLKKRCKKK